MKKYLLLLAPILLSGCVVFPVKPDFPEAPKELNTSCPKLETIDKTDPKLSEFMKTVSNNYQKYHSCAAVVDAWNEWYKKQKEAYNSDIK